MKVTNEIRVYSINGKEKPLCDPTELSVKNVWNKPKFIELQVGSGDKVIVYKHDLLKAIQNATDNE